MNRFLREPYKKFKTTPSPTSTNLQPLEEMWPSKRRKKKSKSRPVPPPAPPPKKQRGWGRRNKNCPKNTDDISIIDRGWISPVKLFDPKEEYSHHPRIQLCVSRLVEEDLHLPILSQFSCEKGRSRSKNCPPNFNWRLLRLFWSGKEENRGTFGKLRGAFRTCVNVWKLGKITGMV